MATIRAYTTIEQSKKLSEILPLESADMYYEDDISVEFGHGWHSQHIPAWSLVALLSVLPNYQLQTQDDGIGLLCSCNGKFNIITEDNAVDACVAMIEKLHELNLL